MCMVLLIAHKLIWIYVKFLVKTDSYFVLLKSIADITSIEIKDGKPLVSL